MTGYRNSWERLYGKAENPDVQSALRLRQCREANEFGEEFDRWRPLKPGEVKRVLEKVDAILRKYGVQQAR